MRRNVSQPNIFSRSNLQNLGKPRFSHLKLISFWNWIIKNTLVNGLGSCLNCKTVYNINFVSDSSAKDSSLSFRFFASAKVACYEPILAQGNHRNIAKLDLYPIADAVRALAVEKLVEGVDFPCVFREYGCTETMKIGEKSEHEDMCPFRNAEPERREQAAATAIVQADNRVLTAKGGECFRCCFSLLDTSTQCGRSNQAFAKFRDTVFYPPNPEDRQNRV